jgi:prephenate dehydrogenase
MSEAGTVAIIGLGLIGGSLARDLAAHGMSILAYDRDETRVRAAIAAGIVVASLDETLAGVSRAETIIVALPVDAAIDALRRLAPFAADARLITDVGSTKTGIVAAATATGLAPRFVGSHPMAGDHRYGWEASRAGLFEDARVYLCAPRDASSDALTFASDLWRDLGAHPTLLPAEEHDRMLAWTSHLPHVLSAALALTLAGAGLDRQSLGPGGRDMTRIAGSSPEMWTAILRENAAEIDAALIAAEREIAEFRGALRHGDVDHAALHARFATARDWFGA